MSCIPLKQQRQTSRPFLENGIQIEVHLDNASDEGTDSLSYDILLDTGSAITAVPGVKVELDEYVELLGLSAQERRQLESEVMVGRKLPFRLTAGDWTRWYGLAELVRERPDGEMVIRAKIRVPLLDFGEETNVLLWPKLFTDTENEGFVFAIVGTDLLFRRVGRSEQKICVCRRAVQVGPLPRPPILQRAIRRVLSLFGLEGKLSEGCELAMTRLDAPSSRRR